MRHEGGAEGVVSWCLQCHVVRQGAQQGLGMCVWEEG